MNFGVRTNNTAKYQYEHRTPLKVVSLQPPEMERGKSLHAATIQYRAYHIQTLNSHISSWHLHFLSQAINIVYAINDMLLLGAF